MAVQRVFKAMKALHKPEKRYRRCVAIDETKTRLGKEQLFLCKVCGYQGGWPSYAPSKDILRC